MEKRCKKIFFLKIAILISVFLGSGILNFLLKENYLTEVQADSGFGWVRVGASNLTVGNIILNEGNNITLTENTTTLVVATASVSSPGGYQEITLIEGKVYRSDLGSNCSLDNNNCYQPISCATSSCVWQSCVATCNFDIWFHADPTDESSSWATQTWGAWIQATGSHDATSSATTSGVEMNTLQALNAAGLYERYNTEDDSSAEAYGEFWLAQTFTIGSTGKNADHNIGGVKLKLFKEDESYSGTTTVSIRATDGRAPVGSGHELTSISINGSMLSTDPSGQWFYFPLPSCQLSSSTIYAIVLSAPYGSEGRSVRWKLEDRDYYYGGSEWYSKDSGEAWNEEDLDCMFEEYSDAGYVYYGPVNVGESNTTFTEKNLIINTGNSPIDMYFYGENLDRQQ